MIGIQMTIHDVVPYLQAFITGVLLGLFYFGGLWITIRKLNRTTHPRRFLAVSFLLRLIPVLYGFWYVLKIDVPVFFLTFAAFFGVRWVMNGMVKKGLSVED